MNDGNDGDRHIIDGLLEEMNARVSIDPCLADQLEDAVRINSISAISVTS